MESFKEIDKKNFAKLFVITLFLGFIPLFSAGYDHDIIFWVMLVSPPLLIISIIINQPKIHFSLTDPNIYLVLFALWSMISFFWSINQLRTVIELIQLLMYVISFFIIRSLLMFATILSQKRVKTLH